MSANASGARRATERPRSGPASGARTAAPDAAGSTAGGFGDALIALQRLAGNQAVAQLVANPTVQRDSGYAAEMAHSRAEALQKAIRPDPLAFRTKIDREAVAETLADLSPSETSAVKKDFKTNTGWDLTDAIMTGVMGLENNLSRPDRTRLLNLLHGTAADQPESHKLAGASGALIGGLFEAGLTLAGRGDEAARAGAAIRQGVTERLRDDPKVKADVKRATDDAQASRNRAKAATIKAALARGQTETVFKLLRQATENLAIEVAYVTLFQESLYVTLLTKLKPRESERAKALWFGDLRTADQLALEGDLEKQAKVDADVKAAGISPEAAESMPVVGEEVRKRRREAAAAVRTRVRDIRASTDQTTAAGRAKGTDYLDTVLGGKDSELSRKVGRSSDVIMASLIEGNEAEQMGTTMAEQDALHDLTPAQVESALRGLNELARAQADRTIEAIPQLEIVREATIKFAIEGYYSSFTTSFDNAKRSFKAPKSKRLFAQVMAGKGGELERQAKFFGITVDQARSISDTGTDFTRNEELLAQRGELSPAADLAFALKRRPKDMTRVRAILEGKSPQEIADLETAYKDHTKGRSLRADMLGTESEQKATEWFSPDAREQNAEKRDLLEGEVVSQAPDRATRLAADGAFNYKRIRNLYNRVIDNRGLFAELHDWSGHLEHTLVEQALRDADAAKKALDVALARPPFEVDLAGAAERLTELRLIRKRMQRSLDAYKESTRQAFDAFVEFAVLITTTIATLGVTGVTLGVARATLAKIGTKLVLKGDEYSVDEFLGDLRDGVIDVATGHVMKAGWEPLAEKIAKAAKPLEKSLAGRVTQQVGAIANRQGTNAVQSGLANTARGQGFWEGQGLGSVLTGEAQHGAGVIHKDWKAGRAGRGGGAKPPPPGGTEPAPVAKPADSEPTAKAAEPTEAPEATKAPETEPAAAAPEVPTTPETAPAARATEEAKTARPSDETDASSGRTALGTAKPGSEGGDGPTDGGDANPAGRARAVELLQERLGALQKPPNEPPRPLTAAELDSRTTSADEALALYDRAVHASPNVEVGLFYDPNTGEFAVQIGDVNQVRAPDGDGWQAIVHMHVNAENVIVRRLPAPADVMGAVRAALLTGSHVEFVQSRRPDGTIGLARVEVTINPRRIIVELPADSGEPARRIDVTDEMQYAEEYGRDATYMGKGSDEYKWVMADLDRFYHRMRQEGGGGFGSPDRTSVGTGGGSEGGPPRRSREELLAERGRRQRETLLRAEYDRVDGAGPDLSAFGYPDVSDPRTRLRLQTDPRFRELAFDVDHRTWQNESTDEALAVLHAERAGVIPEGTLRVLDKTSDYQTADGHPIDVIAPPGIDPVADASALVGKLTMKTYDVLLDDRGLTEEAVKSLIADVTAELTKRGLPAKSLLNRVISIEKRGRF